MKASFTRIAAHAVLDAGAGVVTCVPGFGCSGIFDAVAEIGGVRRPVSFHEETAYAIAHGAALVGRRAAAVFKTHGLAKAANGVANSVSAGTTAGLVVLVVDDALCRHSENILDAPALARGLGIPFERPPVRDLYDGILRAFRRSEALRLPMAVIVDADALDGEGDYAPAAPPPPPPAYRRDLGRHLLCPFLGRHQQRVLEAKLSGGEWGSLEPPALPEIPEGLPMEWRAQAREYLPLFEVFSRLRKAGGLADVAVGDSGIGTLFAFPPFDCMDICTYMGCSLPVALGALMGGKGAAWAVTGDFTFISTGHLGLPEAVQRGLPLKVLILENGRAATTGGQPIPDGMLERQLMPYAQAVSVIANPADAAEVESALAGAARAPGLRIVVARYVPSAKRGD